MHDAEAAGRSAEAEFRRILSGSKHVALYFHHCDPSAPEGDQSVYRRRSGA